MLNSPSDQLFAFEWAPPRNEGWQMNIFFAWTLLFAPLAAFSPRKLSIFEWVLFLGFGWLAFSGLRYVIWFLFTITILTAALLESVTLTLSASEGEGSLMPRWGFFAAGFRYVATQLLNHQRLRMTNSPSQNFPAINSAFGILMLSASLMFLHGFREKWMGDSIRVYETSTTPVAATVWLSQHPELKGELFTDYAFGGYLSFNLQSRKPWMDSRFNAFPPEQWTEYTQVSRAENWQALFDREDINLLMLSQAAQPKLIQAVADSKTWCEKYRDGYAVVFARCGK
jgi:hypothetical protein